MSCITTCDYTGGANAVPVNYQKVLTAGKTFKKAGFPQFALIKGDYEFLDPTDLAEWSALCVAGGVELGPCGVINLGTPNFTTSTDDSPCGETEVIETILQPTFSTYWVDKDNLTHIDYLESFLATYRCHRIVMFDCDGNVYMNKIGRNLVNAVTTAPLDDTVGYEMGLVQSPHVVVGDGNFEKWQMQLELKVNGEEMFAPVKVPGLLEALIACTVTP